MALPSEDGNAASWLRTGGIDVIQTPLSRLRRVRDPRPSLETLLRAPKEIQGLRSIIRSTHADVVVVSSLLMPHAAIAARLERPAVIWQIVDTAVPTIVQVGSMTLVRILSDAVIYGGASLPARHLGARRLPQPATVISPPVETAKFIPNSEARATVRRNLGIDVHAPVIGQVVSINPTKGLDGFLRAAAIIRRAVPEAQFVIVGSVHRAHAAHLDALRVLQGELGLDSSVHWVGERPDTERFYAAMDVFVVSSLPRSEGTTTTAMEALACEVPVVATNVGAVHEVVLDNLTGRLVPAEEPESLASAVVALLADQPSRRRLGLRGRQHIVQNYDLQMCADRYVTAFVAALDRRTRRHSRFSHNLRGAADH